MKKKLSAVLLALAASMPMTAQNLVKGNYGYLYCHMSDKGEWTAYAISRDGYNYQDINGGNPIFNPEEHACIEGGTRDAYITRMHNGKGYIMVTTDMCVRKSHKWDNYGIDLLKSKDLTNWTSVTFDFRKGMQNFCDAATATSPHKDRSAINRVWHLRSFKTFTKLTTPKLLFDWGYATIDADINFLKSNGLYHMLIKKEGGKRGIFTATSKYLNHGWSAPVDDDFVSFEGNKLTEGSSAFQLIGDDTWRVAYIQYSDHPKHYRICKADKYLRNFSDPVDIKGVTAPQHGSFMRITKNEYKMLQKWDKELKNKAK